MNYLLDRKIKRKKNLQIALFLIFLFIIFYFRSPVFSKLSGLSHFLFRPILALGHNTSLKLSDINYFFQSKKFLSAENEDLKSRLEKMSQQMSNYNSVLDENLKIKDILGREAESIEDKQNKNNSILATILSKPNQNFYNTLIIDTGKEQGVKDGDYIFALGNVPIGRVALTYKNSSKVTLFSSPGEETEVVVSGSDIFLKIVGIGGGNFVMVLPRDIILEDKNEVVLPGINPYVVAIKEAIISEPRNSFQKILLTSPVNIQQLKFVQVKRLEFE
jgi:cell shape-determining protein MreC